MEAVKWFRKAAEQFRKDAEAGDANAQYKIGWMFYTGQGMKVDFSEAVMWFQKSIAQNCPEAYQSLGRCFYKGWGVEQNYKEAVRLFRLGADSAQFGLAKCLYWGQGCTKDVSQAIELFRKAAESGDRDAAYALGDLLERGEDVPHNKEDAAKWLDIAVKKGHPLAKTRLTAQQINTTLKDPWPWTDESDDE